MMNVIRSRTHCCCLMPAPAQSSPGPDTDTIATQFQHSDSTMQRHLPNKYTWLNKWENCSKTNKLFIWIHSYVYCYLNVVVTKKRNTFITITPVKWMEVTSKMCMIIIIEVPGSSDLMIGYKMSPVVATTTPADHRDKLSKDVVRNRGLDLRQEFRVVEPALKVGSVNVKNCKGSHDCSPSCHNSPSALPIWTGYRHLLLKHFL